MKTEALTGITAFLNGQEGLHDREEEFSEALIEYKKEVLVLDDLFTKPQRIADVVKCDNLVLSTTGMYAGKLNRLVKAFEKLDYIPQVIIFGNENTALYFCEMAREYKKRGTKFYYLNIIDVKTLQDIGWL